MNKLVAWRVLSGLDRLRDKKASANPLYNKKSNKWVATTVQDFEIVVIRQNNRHGFISLGWGDINSKIIVFSKDKYSGQKVPKKIWNKFLALAKVMAEFLNKVP